MSTLDEQTALNNRAIAIERLLKVPAHGSATMWLTQQLENCNAALAGRQPQDFGCTDVPF